MIRVKNSTEPKARLVARDIVVLSVGSLILLILIPLLMFIASDYVTWTFLPSDHVGRIIGALFSGCGLFFIIWANYELWHVGHGGAAVIGKIKLMSETKRLVCSGPYAMCRNPMHTGLVIYYMGVSFTLNSLVCLLFTCFVGVCAWLFAVYIDEPRLKRDFSYEYEKWSAHTPRFLPFIKKPF